jgi:hypothetical protein
MGGASSMHGKEMYVFIRKSEGRRSIESSMYRWYQWRLVYMHRGTTAPSIST